MNRMTFVIALISLSLSAVGATNKPVTFTDSLMMTPSLDQVPATNQETCADFTGSWKGTCMASGYKIDQAVTIEQKGCAAIAVEANSQKMVIPVGGVLGITGAMPGTPAKTFGTNMETHWNKEMTTLTLQIMGGMKNLELAGDTHGFMMKEIIRLKDGKMYVDIYAMGDAHKLISFCEFEKAS